MFSACGVCVCSSCFVSDVLNHVEYVTVTTKQIHIRSAQQTIWNANIPTYAKVNISTLAIWAKKLFWARFLFYSIASWLWCLQQKMNVCSHVKSTVAGFLQWKHTFTLKAHNRDVHEILKRMKTNFRAKCICFMAIAALHRKNNKELSRTRVCFWKSPLFFLFWALCAETQTNGMFMACKCFGRPLIMRSKCL